MKSLLYTYTIIKQISNLLRLNFLFCKQCKQKTRTSLSITPVSTHHASKNNTTDTNNKWNYYTSTVFLWLPITLPDSRAWSCWNACNHEWEMLANHGMYKQITPSLTLSPFFWYQPHMRNFHLRIISYLKTPCSTYMLKHIIRKNLKIYREVGQIARSWVPPSLYILINAGIKNKAAHALAHWCLCLLLPCPKRLFDKSWKQVQPLILHTMYYYLQSTTQWDYIDFCAW